MDTREHIIQTAIENGADIAGIADMNALKASPSHVVYTKMGDYSGVGTVRDDETLTYDELFNWPETVKSVLVIGLAHPEDRPELDWWDGKGGTPGNRQLMGLIKKISAQIEASLGITTHRLHYYVEKGGVFLKDAAALAGLGCLGKNNMLVTPEYGPRLRLRALFLDTELEPTGPTDFDPCGECKVYCRRVCPEIALNDAVIERKTPSGSSDASPENSADNASPGNSAADNASTGNSEGMPARDGAYDRDLCNDRMEKDIEESEKNSSGEQAPVKYCRKCEFVCPVGK